MKRKRISILWFVGACLLMAVLALAGAADKLNAQIRTRSFEPVTGILLESDVVSRVEKQGRHRRAYQAPDVRYAYRVGQEDYIGTVFAAHRVEVEPAWKPDFIAGEGYPKDAIVVWFDPLQPGASVLQRSSFWDLAWTAGGVILLLATAAIMFLVWCLRRQTAAMSRRRGT